MEPIDPGGDAGTTIIFRQAEERMTGATPMDWSGAFLDARRTSLVIFDGPGLEGQRGFDLDRIAGSLGFRVLEDATIAAAPARLSRLVDIDAVLVRCSGSEPGLEGLLARLDMIAQTHGTRLIVIVGLDGLDTVVSAISCTDAAILCQPAFSDIVIALMAAQTGPEVRHQLRDSGGAGGDTEIDNLSNQLAQLNRTIEALVRDRFPERQTPPPQARQDGVHLRSPGRDYAPLAGGDDAEDQPLTSHRIRSLLRARRMREQIVAADLFADPAWDIMLDLMAARLERAQVSVSSLCIAAAVPPTTAQRWIHQLTDRGLLERQDDPNDGRRIFIALSDEGAAAVKRWFRDSRPHLLSALGLAGG